MKRISTNYRQIIIFCIFFILLFASYSVNLFRIADSNLFIFYERQPEGLVVGRLIKASQDGILSSGGLTGINYADFLQIDNPDVATFDEEYGKNLATQHYIYLENRHIPEKFVAYKSQSGGQAILFSTIQAISPLNNVHNMKLFKAVSALLVALSFTLFLGWIYRNYGTTSSVVCFILLLASHWLTLFAHNLWWSLWSFYIPFLTSLLILEKCYKPSREYPINKILPLVFIAVFLKCFFTGFEFITTTLIAGMCPFVYYAIMENKQFGRFIIDSIKVGITMIIAVLAEMLILVLQIKDVEGSFARGIDHITGSFTKRTELNTDAEGRGYIDILQTYFEGNAFDLGFLPSGKFIVYFGFVLVIIILFCAGILFLKQTDIKKNKALVITTLVSIASPLSWFIIFKEHSFEHPHMDYIVWYMPTFLLGFAVIGVGISSLFRKSGKAMI